MGSLADRPTFALLQLAPLLDVEVANSARSTPSTLGPLEFGWSFAPLQHPTGSLTQGGILPSYPNLTDYPQDIVDHCPLDN